MSTAPRPAGLTRLRALVRKEFSQIRRDPSSLLIAGVMPAILMLIFGLALSLDLKEVRLGLVQENPSPRGRALAASLADSRYLEVENTRDRRDLHGSLEASRLKALVVLPEDFASPDGSPVQILVDGNDPNTANFALNYTQGALAVWQTQNAVDAGQAAPALEVRRRVWFNPSLTSRDYLVPGAMAVVMTLIGTLLTALVVAREWERGTMEALLATPVTPREILWGKFIPYFTLALGALTLCVALAVGAFGVPLRGSLFALYLVSAAFLFPALGLGLLISCATRNQFLASQVAMVAGFLPSLLLSGLIFEIDSMPRILQIISNIIPARHYIPALRTIFLAGDVWPLIGRSVGVLLLMGLILLFLTSRKIQKRLP